MSAQRNKPGADMPLLQLLPNMLTIAGLCAGLSAIRFGVEGNYVLAVQLILAAGVLDGLDGRIARLLGSDSKMGAELDSLADVVNFGVAPPLVLYFWALQDTRLGWIAVLVFAICCVLRLARFNVTSNADREAGIGAPSAYFTGVPSPAAALLVLLPMSVSFAFSGSALLPDILISAHMVIIGLLMISRIPTWSFKTAKVPRKKAKYFLLGGAIAGAALLTYAWVMLVVLCLAYIATIVWCLATRRPPKRSPVTEHKR
ncbi:CDP-diacylglycerol--serine O-phosphatidyltransferase [Marinovum sp.]|uniref:CDP-diacylglycerol--serine O-phosphatidyltransferase n=1 Tax=Marinovum sp. TaxID=2024839 RepID=UPI002B27436F|nr:CDP-diacylglycerol--serine O-phosphatidyltransferase [Marinovum sp.]